MYVIWSICDTSSSRNARHYPAILWFWIFIKGSNNFHMLFSLGPNKVFLVPDSRSMKVRNSNVITVENRWHHWKWLDRLMFLLYSDKLTVVLEFLTLQDKHYICTLSVNIKLICTRYKTDEKTFPNTLISTCF